MKLIYGMVAAVLMSVGASTVQAHQPLENVFYGALTGFAARGASYALKDQSDANDSKALAGAALIATVVIAGTQMNQHNAWTGAVQQLGAALCTYVATMYVVRTVDAPVKR